MLSRTLLIFEPQRRQGRCCSLNKRHYKEFLSLNYFSTICSFTCTSCLICLLSVSADGRHFMTPQRHFTVRDEQQTTDTLPTSHRHFTDTSPTDSRQTSNRRPTPHRHFNDTSPTRHRLQQNCKSIWSK